MDLRNRAEVISEKTSNVTEKQEEFDPKSETLLEKLMLLEKKPGLTEQKAKGGELSAILFD
jgi:hypothetical protein